MKILVSLLKIAKFQCGEGVCFWLLLLPCVFWNNAKWMFWKYIHILVFFLFFSPEIVSCKEPRFFAMHLALLDSFFQIFLYFFSLTLTGTFFNVGGVFTNNLAVCKQKICLKKGTFESLYCYTPPLFWLESSSTKVTGCFQGGLFC